MDKVTTLIEDVLDHRTRIDEERGIIHGVKILGRVSRNGREYSDNALREAAELYKGRPVNLNHPGKANATAERDFGDGLGWLESIEVRPDGVYGDLHYLKTHPAAPMLVEAARRNPKRFGLSHNAEGEVKRGANGKNVVESIKRVHSVDIVQTPATNEGLFESGTSNATYRETAGDKLAAAVLSIIDGDGTDDEKLTLIRDLAQNPEQCVNQMTGAQESINDRRVRARELLEAAGITADEPKISAVAAMTDRAGRTALVESWRPAPTERGRAPKPSRSPGTFTESTHYDEAKREWDRELRSGSESTVELSEGLRQIISGKGSVLIETDDSPRRRRPEAPVEYPEDYAGFRRAVGARRV